MILTHGANSLARGGGDFVEIGGRKYPVVKIGNQLWMAEDLQLDIGSGFVGFYSTTEVQSHIVPIIPSGWRIPYQDDFTTLANYIQSDGYSDVSKALRSVSDWTQGNGDDIYGFNAKPLGYYNGNNNPDVGTAFLLRATLNATSDTAKSHMWLTATDSGINWWNGDSVTVVFSVPVRLVKDAS